VRGSDLSFKLDLAVNEAVPCQDFEADLILTKSGLEEKSEAENLCSFLYHRDGGTQTADLHHPFRGPTVEPGLYTVFSTVHMPVWLEPAIYHYHFEITKTRERDSSYSSEGRLNGTTDDTAGAVVVTCAAFPEIVVTGWKDYISAMVAFAVAAAASYQLGKAATIVSLPLITGYLVVGMVVGPFGTGLVSRYDVYLIGPSLNDLALSFIAFAAGEEINLPALKQWLRAIQIQIGGITVATIALCSIAFATFTGVLPGFGEGTAFPGSCRASIAVLFAVIMVARSPATVVALLQEMGRSVDRRSSKLVVGITVVSDVVVLLGFGVVSTMVSSTCRVQGVNGLGHMVDVVGVLLIFAQFAAVVACGVVVGAVLYLILENPFRRLKVLGGIVIYRSHIKGALIVPFGWFIFYVLGKVEVCELVLTVLIIFRTETSLTVLIFLADLIFTVQIFLTELVLTVPIFLTELLLIVLIVHAEIVLTVLMFLAKLVVTVLLMFLMNSILHNSFLLC
jgi:hypothetical protein